MNMIKVVKLLNIVISQEAKDHLRTMGRRTMTIYAKIMSSCWSPRPDIFVSLKEPVVPEEYNKYEVDGLNIYIYKEAVLIGDSIEIELAKHASDLANKDFDVYGLDIKWF